MNINLTRFIPSLGILFIFIFSLNNFISAQECDECSRPRVGLYDFSMMVTRPDPDSQKEIVRYLDLFYTGAIARSRVRNNEPNKDCLSFWDGAVINAFMLQDGRLRFGQEYTNTPPAGPVDGMDYILWGHTMNTGEKIQSTLLLEAAESRELVKSVSVTYDNNFDAVTAAGESLAEQFGSILTVIKNFERYKRDTDNMVAIRDYANQNTQPEIKINPAKMKVVTEESIDVNIELIDCDGVPLGNRKIYFTDTTVIDIEHSGSTLGKVEPPVVTTDASGKTKVKFTAGKNTGLAEIYAFFPHYKPNGRTGAFMNANTVLIGNPPDDRWILQATITSETIRRSDTSWSEGQQHGVSSLYERSQGTASITGFIENGGLDTTFYASYYEEYGYPIENCSISGYGTIDYYNKNILEWEDPLPNIDVQTGIYRGSATSENTGFEFYYPTQPGELVIAAQCGGTAKGALNWTHSVYWPEREVEHESNNSSMTFSVAASFLHGECSVTKTDSAYLISGSQTTAEKNDVPGRGLETTTRTYSLKAILRANGVPTGVKGDNNVPKEFVLHQNYPNPFNPGTVISYQLPEKGKVLLKVYNVLGGEVATLVNADQAAGKHKVNFNAAGLTSGIYIYKIFYNNISHSGKMLLVK